MTVRDVSDYLQISEHKIRFLIKHKQIPFHNNHGFLRFKQEEIDTWMKRPAEETRGNIKISDGSEEFLYRGKPIKRYKLAASKILIGEKSWNRFPKFISDVSERMHAIKIHDNGREYMHRKEFAVLVNNFNDYLRLSCQLGFIERIKGTGREKQYSPTKCAERIQLSEYMEEFNTIILDCILNIVKRKLETSPDERHAVLLLWFILKLKQQGIQPTVNHFIKDDKERKNYYPLIRFNFSKSFCAFLFKNDDKKEQHFLNTWEKLIGAFSTIPRPG